MAISCFNGTGIPAFKNIKERVSSILVNVDNKQLSTVAYEFAAKRGLDNAIDVFNPENLEAFEQYVNDYFNINRYIEFDTAEDDTLYEDWYLENTNEKGLIDAQNLTKEQIDQIYTITQGTSRVIDSDGYKWITVPMPKNFKQTSVYTVEMQQIKDQAIANGTFKKAPNGNPTNLTEKQWLQVRTKAFKEWFGDWENDPAKASKVIDENGEPLVVYHGTPNGNFSEFNYYYIHPDDGFYFAEDEERSIAFMGNASAGDNPHLFSVFLNIKNPVDLGNNVFHDSVRTAFTTEYKKGTDGATGLDTGTNYKVWVAMRSNQVKSATDNNGEFSRENNNIYHNTTLKDTYYKILDFVKEKQKNRQIVPLAEINKYFGTNIGFNPNTKEFTTRNPKIHGVSIYNPNDTQVDAKRRIDRAQLLNYLVNKFNLKIQEVSPEEYAKKAGDFSNCCVIGDTVYIKHGQNYTNEQIIEEFLHPAIHALYASNKELVDKLLKEAKRMFPDLSSQIEVAYERQGQQVQEEELITQVLSKYLNKEISDNGTDTRTIIDYIKQLFEKIAELFQDLFGNPNVQEGTRVKISGADIREAYSFENLAKLINSKEIYFGDTLSSGEIRKNVTNGIKKQNKKATIDPKTDKIQKTFDEKVNTIIQKLEQNSTRIRRAKDFETYHTYEVKDEHGKWKKADTSVTGVLDKFSGVKKSNEKQSVATLIGTSFDAAVRDFFNKGYLETKYPNLSRAATAELRKELNNLKAFFDNKFKNGYRVITDEKLLQIAGKVTKGDRTLTVAGTMDMLVLANDGKDNVEGYIFDMKTTKDKNIAAPYMEKYTVQLGLYKPLLEDSVSELADNIKGTGIILGNTYYGNANQNSYNAYKIKGDQIVFGDEEIESDSDDIYVHLHSTVSTEDTVSIIDTDKILTEQEMSVEGLSAEELEAVAGLGESAEDVKQGVEETKEQSKAATVTIDSGLMRLENVPTATDNVTLTEGEKTMLGKTIVKYISYYADRLAKDIEFKKKVFGDAETGNSSYANDYFVGKRKTLMTPDVFNTLRDYLFEDEDIAFFDTSWLAADDPMKIKLEYAAEHIQSLINRAWAELLKNENIAITTDGTTEVDPAISDLFEMYEQAEQQTEDRAAYSIDSRTVSYIGSLSSEFKRAFGRILDYVYDENGNIVRNEDGTFKFNEDKYGWHIPAFIPRNVVINKIFDICCGYGDRTQMLDALRSEIVNVPWLQQVVDIIDNDTDLKASFFSTIRKNKSNYIKSYKNVEYVSREFTTEKGNTYTRNVRVEKRISTPLSLNNIVDKILSSVSNNINNNTVKALSRDPKAPIGVFAVNEEGLNELREFIDSAKKTRDRKSRIRAIRNLLAELGIDDVEKLYDINKSGAKNVLDAVLDYTKNIYNVLENKSSKGKTVTYAQDLNTPYYRLAKTIAPLFAQVSEISEHDNGESRMHYTEPTELQTIVGRLSGIETAPDLSESHLTAEQHYDRLFAEKYDKYWQFGYTLDGRKIYYNSWLEELRNNPESRELFTHFVKTSSDDTSYQEQSDTEYQLSIILDYAAGFSKIANKDNFFTGNKNYAIYRIPTMSDKNADERLRFLRIAGEWGNKESMQYMKDSITKKAFEYLRFELARFDTLLSEVNYEDSIEFFSLPKDGKWEEIASGNRKITPVDFLDESGKLFADKSKMENGLKFEYLPMLNKELLNKSAFAQLVCDYLNGDKTSYTELEIAFSPLFQEYLNSEITNIISLQKENGNAQILIESVDDLTEDAFDDFVTEFVYNDYLAACNILNLTVVDPAFHKNSTDLQKRFAEFHSSTTRPDMLATFEEPVLDKNKQPVLDENKQPVTQTKRITDGYMRYVIVEDIEVKSKLINTIKQIFLEAANAAPTEYRRHELLRLAKETESAFSKINITDGQALTSPTGVWKKMRLLGMNNPALDEALLRIRQGDFHLKDFSIVMQAFKPFVFSQREDEIGGKTSLIPTQIKDSEAMLFLANSILTGSNKTNELTALFDFLEGSHYNKDGTYREDGIDLIVFHSAVKTGATHILDIEGLNGKNLSDFLNKQCYNRKAYTKYVQQVSFESWGRQQMVPDHLKNHNQPMPSQGRVLSVADLLEEINGNRLIYTIYQQGKGKINVTKQDFLNHYFELLDDSFKHAITLAREQFGLNNKKYTEVERNQRLSEILLNSIAKDDKYSTQLRQAFTLVNGKFQVPIGDPSLGDKVYGAVLSLLKQTINNQEFPGGPTVIRSCYGMNGNGLSFFKDKDGGLTAEVYASFLDSTMEENCTYSDKKHKKLAEKFGWSYNEGDIISVEDALKANLITEDDITGIADRVPTEGKYSQIRYRIKAFLPSFMGEYFVFPREKTEVGGDDFDIDKVFPRRKHKINRKALQQQVKDGKISQEYCDALIEKMKIDNEIFDMQWQALGHKSSQNQMVMKSDFTPLKDICKKMYPDFGHASHPLVNFRSQIFYHKANSAGKIYVGIAAMNNTAHALCSMVNCGFKTIPQFTIGGVSSEALRMENGDYRFDSEYSVFDGSLISDSLRMFVGASADNAKTDALLGYLNATPITANILKGLIRMGIPLNISIYMMNNPLIKKICEYCESSGTRFEEALQSSEIAKTADVSDEYETFNFKAKDLENKTKQVYNGVPDAIDKATLSFLQAMIPYCRAIKYVTERCSLNSTKNAAHSTGYDANQRRMLTEQYYDGKTEESELLNAVANNIMTEIPYLGTLASVNTDIIPEIFESFSPLFSPEFSNGYNGIMQEIKAKGVRAEQLTEKEQRKILNAWLIYKASGRKMIDMSEKNRKRLMFEFPVEFSINQPLFADNDFITNVLIKRMNSKYNIISLKYDISHRTSEEKDDLTDSYSQLIELKDEKVQEFLDKYMDYMLVRYGFTFNPQSSITLTPNKAKLAYKNKNGSNPYTNLFAKSANTKESLWNDVVTNFIYQYARNNPYSPVWYRTNDEELEYSKLFKNGKLKVGEVLAGTVYDKGSVGISTGRRMFIPTTKTVIEDDQVYQIYEEVKQLGIENQFLEYNAKENWSSMNTVITNSNISEQNKLISTLNSEQDVEEGEPDSTADETPFAADWFVQMMSTARFKNLMNALGASDFSYLKEVASMQELIDNIQQIYDEAQNAGIENKHKKIMEEIKEKICTYGN